jgi:hypothetical protein
MATITPKVFKHHKKADGTYNVKICIYHKKERVDIDTVHYITEKKLTSIFTIKDPVIARLVNQTLEDYDEVQESVLNMLRDLDNNQPKFRFQLQKLFKSRCNNLRATFGMYFNC